MAQAGGRVGAAAMGVSMSTFDAFFPNFARARQSIHYSNSNMTAPIVTPVAAGACEPKCPAVKETEGAPAGVEAAAVENTVRLEGAPGVVLHQIRQASFLFARTMSQERTELEPGALRPMVWTSADAVLVVLSGKVAVSLQGGIPGAEAHLLTIANETLVAGDVAYLPNGRAFWFQEATGKETAATITVFNVGNWKSFEMHASLKEMPKIAVASNLHINSADQALLCSRGGVGNSESNGVFQFGIKAPMLLPVQLVFAAGSLAGVAILLWSTRRYRMPVSAHTSNPLLS
jgi:hypothetical protein